MELYLYERHIATTPGEIFEVVNNEKLKFWIHIFKGNEDLIEEKRVLAPKMKKPRDTGKT